MEVSVIGLDIAKQVFQVCGLDDSGTQVVTRRLRRSALLDWFAALPATVVGIEACSTAHHWGRALMALGHDVRLLPPRQVKRYNWGNKTDAADAAAICAALRDGRIRPVPVKTVDQQAVLGLHRTRELLVRQRTEAGNALRSLFAEMGVVAAQGRDGFRKLLERTREPEAEALPPMLLAAVTALAQQWQSLDEQVRQLEGEIVRWCRADTRARRLTTIPGIGPITASALSASIGDVRTFATGRHLAAWLGLTPREHSSGLKRRQGGIGKQGNGYLRRLLVLGAHAVMRHRRPGNPNASAWLDALRARRPAPVAAVALAAKNARIAWAVMARGQPYQACRTVH